MVKHNNNNSINCSTYRMD